MGRTINLVDIYAHTRAVCRDLEKHNELNTPSNVIYSGVDEWDALNINTAEVILEVVNADTIDVALQYREEKPLVLNMASNMHPGGGVEKGALAQEEELFRRTDYHRHLNKTLVKYPMKPLDMIISRGVTVIKKSREEDYKNYRDYTCLDFVAVTGLRNPKIINGKYLPADEELLRNKIRLLLHAADERGYTCLILGALGCGAFNNPPQLVASIFKEEIEKYKYTFHRIIFAVLSSKRGRGENNFEVFRDILAG